MNIKQETATCSGVRFSAVMRNKEVGRAYLYIMHNNLHEEPFGLLEDLFVNESLRGRGIGTQLLNKVVEEARKNRCYKLIATSRHSREEVHKLYKRFGFENHGLEFRIDF